MRTLSELYQALEDGALDDCLRTLACLGVEERPTIQRARTARVARAFQETFGRDDRTEAAMLSAPGRTEIGGNHTDHQHGRVLAAAVDVDLLACAAPNGTHTIRFQSEGWPLVEVDLSDRSPRPEEKESTAALIRGMAARAAQLGYVPAGFDAYVVSDVLPGSGLSSSAACEVLIGNILNVLFCRQELSPVTIAQMGQYAENVYFGKPSGLMDQMASSVGGAVAIDFADPSAPVVEPRKVDLAAEGYALCIIDSGADHIDLTAEYAAIPGEMRAVAAFFGKEVLREVPEDAFLAHIPELRAAAGDRAVLRALHFFEEDRRAAAESAALAAGDFQSFLELVRSSGRSSWVYLQNVSPAGTVREQPVAVALAAAELALGGRGAFRVHGGGFAGTIQAFVPLDLLETFRHRVEAVLGEGRCHVMSIRPVGGAVLWA
ncbi:galactokinase family protein [Pseudoflavonifractor sp. MSJ-37]|uniref:galactokinase n=1 Tax=Pseudoflavonifractor sp. MSJ-37 TaxID=2841531 RepID=UPI001C12497E|nr:galactokinase family protein [Pseudoflavonifractor sp. MSJ-37]MBU5436308.1 galactokinase [Pseudoflavonifractor sp. MSJ-37]